MSARETATRSMWQIDVATRYVCQINVATRSVCQIDVATRFVCERDVATRCMWQIDVATRFAVKCCAELKFSGGGGANMFVLEYVQYTDEGSYESRRF